MDSQETPAVLTEVDVAGVNNQDKLAQQHDNQLDLEHTPARNNIASTEQIEENNTNATLDEVILPNTVAEIQANLPQVVDAFAILWIIMTHLFF